jgi:DNA-binding XRE family transcriptional regulator
MAGPCRCSTTAPRIGHGRRTARAIVDCGSVNAATRTSPDNILSILAELSGIPLTVLQSPTQVRRVGQVRSAAAHLLRVECGLSVSQVGPLLGRSAQTVCDLSRNARLALEHGGDIADLITRAQQVVMGGKPERPGSPELWLRTAVGVGASTPAGQRRTFAVPHLRHCRTHAGLGQAELAQRTGIARETLARLENGRGARRDVIVRLADALLIAPSELMQSNDLDGTTGEEYRICRSCGVLRPVRAFVPIRGTGYVYLRCRACRARRARERYQNDPRERQSQIERARRNRAKRKLAAGRALASRAPPGSAIQWRAIDSVSRAVDSGQSRPVNERRWHPRFAQGFRPPRDDIAATVSRSG